MTTISLILDKNNYITNFCIGGIVEGGTDYEIDSIPEDFYENFLSYKYENGCLALDEDKLIETNAEEELEALRYQRERICFSVIDRSQLWYSTLTDEQISELKVWYNAWLNVTKTKVIPEKPLFI